MYRNWKNFSFVSMICPLTFIEMKCEMPAIRRTPKQACFSSCKVEIFTNSWLWLTCIGRQKLLSGITKQNSINCGLRDILRIKTHHQKLPIEMFFFQNQLKCFASQRADQNEYLAVSWKIWVHQKIKSNKMKK